MADHQAPPSLGFSRHKTILKKKKCKKAKWLSEEALQIAVKRREEVGTGDGRDMGSRPRDGGA